MRLPSILVLAIVLATACSGAFAADPKNELTFAGSLFNANQGPTVWNLDAEVLVPLGKYIVLGPSLSMFDLGEVDGSSLGGALEANLMGGNGLFFGGAAHYPSGDLKDAVDYTYEVRAGVKLGEKTWFAKLYASRLWSKTADATIDPDGTRFTAGIGARF